MNYLKISLLGITLFIFSCDEVADDTACVDSTATVFTASASYGTDMSYSNCQALKTAALDFASNSCDTTGVGDLSFVIDSLDCNQMACALPLVNLIAYGFSMQMATNTATYCLLFDSTMMAADTLLKYNCWGEDSTAYYTAYFDSMETAGCDWQEIDIVGQWDGISLCIYADAENCSGDCPTLGTCWVDGQMIESDDSTSCIVNGGIWENNTPDFSLVINENGTISEPSDCDCDSYSDDCDEEAADAATDLTSCTAAGGNWDVGEIFATYVINGSEIIVTFNEDCYECPTDFLGTYSNDQLTFTYTEPGKCRCDEYNIDCDEEAADAATDLTSCTAVGGEWHGPTCISITTEKYSDGS
jgi:hypothetical protein